MLVLSIIALSIKYDLIENIIDKTRQQGSTFRVDIWKTFLRSRLELFPDIKFFIGEGFKSFSRGIQHYPGAFPGDPLTHVHNLFLDLWGRFGLINMLLIMYFLFNILKGKSVGKAILFNLFIPVALLARDIVRGGSFIGIFRWEMISSGSPFSFLIIQEQGNWAITDHQTTETWMGLA